MDHIDPIAIGQIDQTWDQFIDRLFCEEDNLQVLCLTCHKAKSLTERKKK